VQPPARVRAAAPGPPADGVWARLRNCESGGRYDRNSGNGYYGAYQFHPGTWRSLGYSGMPHEAPPHVQDEAAQKLQARSGWGQWPACSRRIGAR
ncbi:MAG: transglycosylase family protein, partial [Acidimicrobiia bacterium]